MQAEPSMIPSIMEECSSIGRAPVSKTGGWGFESLLACQLLKILKGGCAVKKCTQGVGIVGEVLS